MSKSIGSQETSSVEDAPTTGPEEEVESVDGEGSGTDEEVKSGEGEGSSEDDPEDGAEGESGDGGDSDKGLSHEDALEALRKVRRSEAKTRRRLREAEQALQAAKTPEEVEQALAKIREDSAKDARELMLENVALKHGLPEDLAGALKGETREELDAHAKVLAKYVPTAGGDPDVYGGLDPLSDDSDDLDPAKAARAALRVNRRF